jgi:hypothetical protein
MASRKAEAFAGDELATLQLTQLRPLPPTMERQDSRLASIKSGLLRCGILTRLWTGLDHERLIGSTRNSSALPQIADSVKGGPAGH